MVNSERSKNHVVLSAQEIAKPYGQLEALTDLTLEVRAGEILGLLGPNAAGKTTAIRVLTTILPGGQEQPFLVFTRQRSLVRSQYRPPCNSAD